MESHLLHCNLRPPFTSLHFSTAAGRHRCRDVLHLPSPHHTINPNLFSTTSPLFSHSHPLLHTKTSTRNFSGDVTGDDSDLAPVPVSRRTFTAWDMASLWIGLVVGVPSYYLAGALVNLGMAWWQGIATVTLANFIVLLPLLLAAVPGTRHGIPFPILARSAFGVHGAHLPSLLRAFVGCGWYGIESWIGGQAVFVLLPCSVKQFLSSPALGSPSPLEFACFFLFWLAQLAIIWRGMDGIRELERYSAPILILLTTCLLSWAYINAGGIGRMLSLKSRLSSAAFWPVFFPSLNANISFWATVALNIPDISRHCPSQWDQIIGQLGLPIFMGLFTFVGLAVTSSTEAILGRVISDPIHLLGEIGGLPTKILSILGISLATITTNIAANVIAPANALVNLNASAFTFRRGALLTALLGVAFQPWKLMGSSESFIYTWLLGYSALMGPIGGIMLADYYLVKKMQLEVGELYVKNPSGKYYFTKGYNPAAMAAMIAGVSPVVPGFLNKVGILSNISGFLMEAYNNAWFVSFFLAGTVHWVLSLLQERKKRGFVGTFT
ncbi:hypothetical protein AXF42_Ash015814 [Apostasia shenzhenica]|uniref:Allantoin permease n=1 Tax=Apostasia shenzhenica TaxID=1088818 RepID=A0A2H9ZXL6_9ASPA|nr:hypothetical protein AXF42_Ash015814 [Apostasia shenzhenica]